jgi:hypothetical protein
MEPEGPGDFDRVEGGGLVGAEVDAEIVLREVAAAAMNLVRLRDTAGDHFHARADCQAVALSGIAWRQEKSALSCGICCAPMAVTIV